MRNAISHTKSGAAGGFLRVYLAVGATICVGVRDLGGHGVPRLRRARDGDRGSGQGIAGVAARSMSVGWNGSPEAGHLLWAQFRDYRDHRRA
ncbi:hypothetical protein [Actinocorallia lasiicapitis]